MHFHWSLSEATDASPIHFTLPHMISVFGTAQRTIIAGNHQNGCRFETSAVRKSRWFYKKKKGGEKGVIVWSLCVIASKPTWGVALCVYCFCPVRVTPPLSVPLLCLSAAYRCYAHYLKIEVSQSHPVMKAFCGMLLQSMSQESNVTQRSRDAEEGL